MTTGRLIDYLFVFCGILGFVSAPQHLDFIYFPKLNSFFQDLNINDSDIILFAYFFLSYYNIFLRFLYCY